MRKQPLLLLCLLFFLQSHAQQVYGIKTEMQLPKTVDPEYLWRTKDSLDAVDTVKFNSRMAEYYRLHYTCDANLYTFDKDKSRLNNCLKWTEKQLYHDTLSQELCVQGMNCGKQLNDSVTARHYLTLLEANFPEGQWTSATQSQVSMTKSHFNWGTEDYWSIMDFDIGVSCGLDTTVVLHENKQMWPDPERWNEINFIDGGDSTFISFHVATKDCRCRDCEHSMEIVLYLENGKLPEAMSLNSGNCFFGYWNVWNYSPIEKIYRGKFFRNAHGTYLVLCTRQRPEDELELLGFYWFSQEKIAGF